MRKLTLFKIVKVNAILKIEMRLNICFVKFFNINFRLERNFSECFFRYAVSNAKKILDGNLFYNFSNPKLLSVLTPSSENRFDFSFNFQLSLSASGLLVKISR